MRAKKYIISYITVFLFILAIRFILPFFDKQLASFWGNNFILAYIILFLFFAIYGIVSIYTGFLGLIKGEMELFWKKYYPYGKYWKSASTKKIKREMDVTRGNYAKFWGVIYIFWGITMAGGDAEIKMV